MYATAKVIAERSGSRTIKANNEVWQAWDKQGVSKPNNEDFDTAMHNPLILMQQYFN